MKRLTALFPRSRIIAVINGHYKEEEHKKYLTEVMRFCNSFNNVSVFSYHKPVGLSTLWNRAIHESGGGSILFLNDDLKIRSASSG